MDNAEILLKNEEYKMNLVFNLGLTMVFGLLIILCILTNLYPLLSAIVSVAFVWLTSMNFTIANDLKKVKDFEKCLYFLEKILKE